MISNSRLRRNEKLWAMGYKHLKEIENQNLESNHKMVTMIRVINSVKIYIYNYLKEGSLLLKKK